MADQRLLGIEISDLGITAARLGAGGTEVIPLDGNNPELSGFAQLTGDGEVIFGASAFRQFLTSKYPLDNAYWYRLAAVEDVGSARKGSGNQPSDDDLARAHLTAVFQKCLQDNRQYDSVALAVPGHFRPSRLGTLIQIAEQAGMAVDHVLDTSLAALLSSVNVPAADSLLVLDLHWNTVDVVRVDRTSNTIERLDVASDRGLGLRLLLDRMIDGVGKRFIDECRFDPAARPEYAQALYNQVYAYLENDHTDSVCKLETSKGSIALNRADLYGLIEKELKSLDEVVARAVGSSKGEADSAVFLTARINRLPGLSERLSGGHVAHPLLLNTGQAAMGALQFLNALEDQTPSDGPLYHSVIEFDVAKTSNKTVALDSPRVGKVYVSGSSGVLKPTPATHLLFQGRLLPLPMETGEDFVIGKNKNLLSGLVIIEPVQGLAEDHIILRRRDAGELEMINNGRNTTLLNGEAVASGKTVVVQTGDVLTLGDSVLQLMIVGLASDHA